MRSKQEPQHALRRLEGDRPRRGNHRRRRGEDEPAGVRRSRLRVRSAIPRFSMWAQNPRLWPKVAKVARWSSCGFGDLACKLGDLRPKLATFAHFLAAFAKSWRPCPLILAILITFFGDLRAHSGALEARSGDVDGLPSDFDFCRVFLPSGFPSVESRERLSLLASLVSSGAGVQAAPCCCSNWRMRS